MKRSPLKRKTPLRQRRRNPPRRSPSNIPGDQLPGFLERLRAKPRLKRKRVNGDTKKYSRRARKGADPAYLSLVRGLPCSAAAIGWCRGQIVAHHPRHLAGGVGMKAPDSCAIALCDGHHRDLHSLSGPFKGWTRAQLRDWQDAWVAATQKRLRESR